MAEQTFRSYTHEQGQNYAKVRPSYNSGLYEIILDHHTSTGGKLSTVLDVGCGPGNVVRDLAPRFSHGIGLDASKGMISTAQELGGNTSTSEPIRFEVSAAEDLGSDLAQPILDSSVDLLTVATAAHWFDMSGFWPRAAQVLKPGGTVAIWGGSSWFVHPSNPNHVALQVLGDDIEERFLKPYMEPGNIMTRNFYRDLKLPWTIEEPALEFEKGSFYRREWNKDGHCDDGEDFSLGQRILDLDALEARLGTSSPVQRWREAHPDAVGTDKDVVKIMRREVERLLQEGGMEKGKETLTYGVGGVLLMVKKKA